MLEMIWKEPPPLVSSEKAATLAELQKNPGRWALVQARYKSTSATTAWKKLGCEATHRRANTTEGKSPDYDIYARWPEPKTSTPKTADVEKAISTGTALVPPPPVIPRKGAPAPVPSPAVNDMGLSKFIADRRARGA